MRTLLAKDLRILRRSPSLVGLLVVYPALIAVLIGLALSKGPGKPRVAVFNQLPPTSSGPVQVGGTRVDPQEYARRLYTTIDPVSVHSLAEAKAKVRDGDVLAAVVVPPDLVTRIQQALALSGTASRPTIDLLFSAKDPVKQQFVQSTIDSQVAALNRALSGKLTEVAAGYLNLLLRGGRFSLLGQHVDIAGLQRAKVLVDQVIRRLPASSPDRASLAQVSTFAALAIDNLDLSGPILTSISQPIAVHEAVVAGRRTPLDTYAVAVAVTLALMLVAVLLGAGMLALEREEHAFARLVRGLVSRWTLVAEKALLAAGCAAATALVMAGGVSLFVGLDRGRFALWVAALAAGGVAFGTLGVALGALAREVRAASLLAILLALPVAFLALVPSGAVAGGLYDVIRVACALFPFRTTVQGLTVAFDGGSGFGTVLAHLAALVVGWALVARVGLQRF